ncbi:SLC13 family permease [Fischerella thermalis]|uniref:Sodium-dependent dicarboxylate transporter SdcS n=1 Tax=Fischerella thermalis CCMEE 5318 TaxID=2019666 RepID=A0A2N6LD70_9CYAN|nr:SLC13 family permease [Fischerella thermalis]PMB20982.1 sodium:solute symporter [Fischerella thermalis CCMEE 5318]
MKIESDEIKQTAINTQLDIILQYFRRLSRWQTKLLLALFLTFISGVTVFLSDSLSIQGRLTIIVFLLTVILWSMTSINAGYIALVSVLMLLLTGSISQEDFFESLGSDVVWLMIGAFILGGAVKQTGLATRLTQAVAAKAHNVSSLFWLLTTVLIPLSFLIPSTSGRAAVTHPIFRSVANAIEDKRTRRALAILMPSIILVSTIASLTGAGSHLVAKDLLEEISEKDISFSQWLLYGLPFGIVASYATCWVIMQLFLDRRRWQQKLDVECLQSAPLSLPERKTLMIVLLMLGLWLTEKWHGLEIATVTVIGAILLTAPKFGVMKWKDAVKDVSWNLIIFVGATLALGHALISSGASEWIINNVFRFSDINTSKSHFLILLLLAIISLTSHIYMTSHTARAAALVPPLLYLASSLDINPVTVLFISTLGMDYCLTFPVSSKALMVYQDAEEDGFKPKDLLRLSSVMIVVHFVLIVLFYYTWWRWVGLSL